MVGARRSWLAIIPVEQSAWCRSARDRRRPAQRPVTRGVATPGDIDAVVKYSFGRRLGVAGVLEIMDLGGLDTLLGAAIAVAGEHWGTAADVMSILVEKRKKASPESGQARGSIRGRQSQSRRARPDRSSARRDFKAGLTRVSWLPRSSWDAAGLAESRSLASRAVRLRPTKVFASFPPE
jgi:3-hydroxyacyl-CoA dehydrogenase